MSSTQDRFVVLKGLARGLLNNNKVAVPKYQVLTLPVVPFYRKGN